MQDKIGKIPEYQAVEHQLVHLAIELATREGCPIHEALNRLLLALNRLCGVSFYECWYSLTVREQQIALLICYNHTNNEIAARLSLSKETVKSHVSTILRKFQLPSRYMLRRAIECIGLNFQEEGKRLELDLGQES